MTPEQIRQIAANLKWLTDRCDADLAMMDGEPDEGDGLPLNIKNTRGARATVAWAEHALTDFAELLEGIDAARAAKAT